MVNWLSQTDRLLQLTTPLGEDALYLTEFTGIEEISNPFNFNLHMFSENTNIVPAKIIGKPVSVQITNNENEIPRYFHGIVTSFQAGFIENSKRYYTAYVKPWLSMLSYTSDCRVFQNKNVIDILKIIFNEYGFNNYELNGLSKPYKKRNYCVQYHETSLNFIHRLLEEEGIFYFFRHEKNNHVLILGDKNTVFKSCLKNEVQYTTSSSQGNHLLDWNRNYTFYSGNHVITDYNFETPDTSLIAEQRTNAKLPLAGKYSSFNYPGNHQTVGEGKNITQQFFEAEEANHDIVEGTGNYSSFTAGGKFKLSEAPITSDEGDYILTVVSHYAKDGSYLTDNEGITPSDQQIYRNSFTCMPINVNYIPLRKTLKPLIQGSQTAIVVGPEGQELYTDKYGRIFIQFHWDRKGKKDDQSSCWVRVMQSWAGKNWGTLFIPRIGQEVVVQFLNGDPDKPIIIGSLYNADNLPPYNLPFDQTQSGIKTRSTKGGGISDSNELRFEDKVGQEEIFIQAQKDFNQIVKNNLNVQIGNQSTLQAQKSIELKVDGNSLLINNEGIFINGEKVNINN